MVLNGWVQRTRNLGGVIFVWLRDREGLVQAVFNSENCDAQTFALGESLRGEYVVAVAGEVVRRAEKDVNESMATGRVEVLVQRALLLNASSTPPIYIEDKTAENEAVRLKYRYLDLRRPSMQRTLRMRHQVTSAIRRHLEECGFIEVETPILSKSTPRARATIWCPAACTPARFMRCRSLRRFTSSC